MNREEREEHRRWRRRRRHSGTHALGGLIAGLFLTGAGVGLYAAAQGVELRAQRGELADSLGSLVTALRSYEAANGRYISVGSPVEAYDALDAGRAYAPADVLGWRADGVRGVYWVLGRENSFEAHGMLDADGDGLPAHWMATESRPPYPITDDGVY